MTTQVKIVNVNGPRDIDISIGNHGDKMSLKESVILAPGEKVIRVVHDDDTIRITEVPDYSQDGYHG